MNDPGAMRHIERRRDLDRDGQGLRRWERAFLEPRRQRFAVEQLHDEERRALLLANVM
jgi:hypothetical protein